MPQERWATLKREDPQFDPADRFLFGKARESSAAALCCRPFGAVVRYYDSDMYSITESRREPPFGAEGMPFDLSYWEALRAYWRYYWPPQLLVFCSVAAGEAVPGFGSRSGGSRRGDRLVRGMAVRFAPLSRPYRGFSLVIVETPAEVDVPRLTLGKGDQGLVLPWWRQIVAGVVRRDPDFFLKFMLSIRET